MAKSNTRIVERPPIVVVMGHVDHGKSTLLDYIRKANTVDKEAGGITQHVAAYEVEREIIDPSTKLRVNKRITFIDTPGHAAFEAIRARGARAADIAILVVAADDGVKPQTLEALQKIREAKIPFIVAINKIDKPQASVERTQAAIMQEGVYLENLGGDVPWAAISAKTGQGVGELLDLILLVAEILELKGDHAALAKGYVIEAHRDQKRGLAATLVITNGTLKLDMAILAGRAISPVRIVESTSGKSLQEISFSSPVRLVGFDELPEAGAEFQAYINKREAGGARPSTPPPARLSHASPEDEGHFYLPLIVRADAAGSLEALEHELAKLGDEHSSLRIVASGIGNVAEADAKTALAGAVHGIVIGFNVRVDPIAASYAQQHGIRIETFDIIYKLTERLEELLREMRPRRAVEEVVGRAKVLKQFSSRKNESVIGGSVLEGYLSKGAQVRVLRRGTLIGLGKIKNIQSHKADVERVDAGGEFGALVLSPFEVAQGDSLECSVIVTK